MAVCLCKTLSLLTRKRWSSASIVKRDSSLITMRNQSEVNHDNRLRHHSRRFRRCWGVKGSHLQCRCKGNPDSAKRREIGKGITRGMEEQGRS
ncbi:hypothetical protein TNCV_4228101 [Trichonephila clavipes]|nr:hypothetical protein TNCV_4228101 [Trichonephila clavipes]